jgi:hypothetical protein
MLTPWTCRHLEFASLVERLRDQYRNNRLTSIARTGSEYELREIIVYGQQHTLAKHDSH